MPSKISEGVFLVEGLFGKYDVLLGHILSNKDKFDSNEGCCIRRYTVDPADNSLSQEFLQICKDYIDTVGQTVESVFNVQLQNKGNFIVGAHIYGPNCFMSPHNDLYDEHDKANQNIVSSVHFLNDDFGGGELVFEELGLSIAPKANSLVIFNSELMHYTMPISYGQKVSCTRFWKGILQ